MDEEEEASVSTCAVFYGTTQRRGSERSRTTLLRVGGRSVSSPPDFILSVR